MKKIAIEKYITEDLTCFWIIPPKTYRKMIKQKAAIIKALHIEVTEEFMEDMKVISEEEFIEIISKILSNPFTVHSN